MPADNVSNRERLLKLIDGNPDALKETLEVQQPKVAERSAPPEVKVPTLPKIKIHLSNHDILNLVKILAVVGIVIAVLHYGLEFFKVRVRATESVARTQTPSVAGDESGVGLRLVGVDSSNPPVALLEDLKTGKTYFAKKNDNIKGARVQEISKNKVTLSAHGKTVELR